MKKLLIVALLGLFSLNALAGCGCNSKCPAKSEKVEKTGCESGCGFFSGCSKKNNNHK